mmetsp:Transcript_30561/g.71553  ORF Transcript_30561/g.71553 Transcript_30561/m.71553 type:complete len:213 (-) Transcript_30561:13-651(-)
MATNNIHTPRHATRRNFIRSFLDPQFLPIRQIGRAGFETKLQGRIILAPRVPTNTGTRQVVLLRHAGGQQTALEAAKGSGQEFGSNLRGSRDGGPQGTQAPDAVGAQLTYGLYGLGQSEKGDKVDCVVVVIVVGLRRRRCGDVGVQFGVQLHDQGFGGAAQKGFKPQEFRLNGLGKFRIILHHVTDVHPKCGSKLTQWLIAGILFGCFVSGL